MEDEQGKATRAVDVRRVKFEQTSAIAATTIEAERKARLEKTARLQMAREARDSGTTT